jgi:hypothetical protein
MTQIILRNPQIKHDDVREMIEKSREILCWNGNTTWNREIVMVTDNLDLAHRTISIASQVIPEHERSAYTGYCWLNHERPVLWVRSRAYQSTVKTLAHEVSHALCKSSHGHTWRRGFSLLLPFWYRKFLTTSTHTIDRNLLSEVSEIVHKYTRRGQSADHKLAEINAHMTAIQRTLRRWDDTRDKTGLHRVPGWYTAPTAQLYISTSIP